jgi:F-type H+-transporting ATPase subunit a
LSAGLGLLAASRPPDPFDAPGLDIFNPPCLAEWNWFGVEFCVNRHTIYLFAAAAIVITLFVIAAMRPGVIPRGIRNFVETIVEFVRNQIVLEVIGPDGLTWVPFLTSLFSFILVANLFAIIPGVNFPVTSRMAIPALLAAIVWVIFNAVGVRAQGVGGYLKSVLFPPGVPWPIYFLLTPIEFVSTFLVRPLTLSVRLLANMMAGHLILTIFFLGTAYLLAKPTTIPFAIPALGLAIGLTAFELLVAVLQAYIFTILTAVYLAGAMHPEH